MENEQSSGTFSVTHHALLRYIERERGYDLDGVMRDILECVREAVPFKNCDGRWHAKTQTVYITNSCGGVVTILSRKQSQKYIGRRLVNGERAQATATLWKRLMMFMSVAVLSPAQFRLSLLSPPPSASDPDAG